jgi:Flp pilus assembly pilin Flp
MIRIRKMTYPHKKENIKSKQEPTVIQNRHKGEPDNLDRESGANLAEYSILVALLLCIALIAIQNVGKEVSAVLSGNARAIKEANQSNN